MSDAGWPLENAQAKTLDDLIEALNAGGNVSGADLVRVRALIVARQETVSNAPGKLRAACQRVSPDGRLRDAVKYAGAHTLRWAGVGFQPQNLTIGCTDDDVKAALG
jgi:hypothetical protein